MNKTETASCLHSCLVRSALACVCVALASRVPATSQTIFLIRGDAAHAFPFTNAAGSESLALDRPVYRLGNAARPFGWSTAIADLNADGRPDFAIADQDARRGGDYRYRIQFSVSGLEPDQVAFESKHNAVTIGVSDVDHDNDVDIVVSAILSHEVVGVWLNDGHAHFAPADVRLATAAIRPSQTLSHANPSDQFTSGLSPRRADQGLSRASVPAFSVCQHPLLVSRRISCRSSFHSSAGGPRAPPHHP